MVENRLRRFLRTAQQIYRKFNHLERRIHEVSNIQESIREPPDGEILRLDPGEFLFELRSTESINESKYACQCKGEKRPGFGRRQLCFYLRWEKELELNHSAQGVRQDGRQPDPESRRQHGGDQTAQFTGLKRLPIFRRYGEWQIGQDQSRDHGRRID